MEHQFTALAQNALNRSLYLARELGHTYIGTEHLLLGLITEGECTASAVLRAGGLDASSLREALIRTAGQGTRSSVTPDALTPACRRVIELSSYEAMKEGAGEIGTGHLLSAVLSEEDCTAARMIAAAGVTFRSLRAGLAARSSQGRDTPDPAAEPSVPETAASARERKEKSEKKRPEVLTLYTRDLNELARTGRLDPVIGRERETDRVIRVLSRRTKNNPCLIGEPGVGKTAIVEGLAQRIERGEVPLSLRGKTILSVDLPSMIAGAKYRGEFEDRMKKLLSEASSSPDVILFIDELHTLVGAGNAEGAVDASNILKPGLARGEFRVIGATTDAEYRKRLGKDAALERRFQPVFVEEPGEEEAAAILSGLREKLEAHHGVTVEDGAIRAAVSLSAKYVSGRFLPDKALDLLDECAAGLSVGRKGEEVPRVTAGEIARTLTEETGIPVGCGEETGEELERRLNEAVLGQEEAVRALARAVIRSRAGLHSDTRPVGSFVFIGPSGVGKTALALSLAEVLFGTKNALLRYDMSEYAEKASVARLIGSPPGYVGYEEGGQLTDAVCRRPYAVVLFDEIEKAHPDLAGLLLRILDTGSLTDARGKTVSFRSAVVILTCNHVGAAGSMGSAGFGDRGGDERQRLLGSLFRPELIDRIDEVIPFRPLTEEVLRSIAGSLLHEVERETARLGHPLTVSGEMRCRVASLAGAEKQGARCLRRLVRRLAEDPVAECLASRSLPPGAPLFLGADGSVTVLPLPAPVPQTV